MTTSTLPFPDPRGPTRTITAITERSDATILTLSCGHVSDYAPHFTYKLGAYTRCFDCGRAELAAWEETQRGRCHDY